MRLPVIKRVHANGNISIGKELADRWVRIERLDATRLVLTPLDDATAAPARDKEPPTKVWLGADIADADRDDEEAWAAWRKDPNYPPPGFTKFRQTGIRPKAPRPPENETQEEFELRKLEAIFFYRRPLPKGPGEPAID